MQLSLRVAVDANAAAYRRAVQASTPGDCWDALVLTATNEKQAEGYRQELALRHLPVGPTGAFLPTVQRSLVVPDPPPTKAIPRVGSGGATLGVLRHLMTLYTRDELLQKRILLIHSGGLSQRLPAYSPVGKIFAPLPLSRPDGQVATLFDHLYTTLAGLPDRLGPGMLVLAGDVFLLFDHRHVPALSGDTGHGCTAITIRVDPEVAAAHGVFVTDAAGRITRTLQKVTPDAMRIAGAVGPDGKVEIDTGILFFAPDAVGVLIDLTAKKLDKPLDLYEEMVGAMTPGARVTGLLKPLSKLSLGARSVAGEFLHLGTTRQFRDALVGRNPSPAAELFQENLHAQVAGPVPEKARVYHSAVEPAATFGEGAVVDHSLLQGPAGTVHEIGRGSVVSQVMWGGSRLRLPDETLYFQCPLRLPGGASAVAHVVCGTGDEFKSATFFGAELSVWMKSNGVTPGDLWPAATPVATRTLWNARMFPTTPKRGPSDLALSLFGKLPTRKWRANARVSMADVLTLSDPRAIVAHRERLSAHLQATRLVALAEGGSHRPLTTDVFHYATPEAYAQFDHVLREYCTQPLKSPGHALVQSRLLLAGYQLAQRPAHPDPQARYGSAELADLAFRRIAQGSELAYAEASVPLDSATPLLPVGSVVTATSPVRLDLAGGWSDTPPYCYEMGGHVINLAVDLEGAPPIRVTAERLRKKVLILESHDLGQRAEFESLPSEVSLSDPLALHKIAVQMLGLTPETTGLRLTTECRVPKGSGLGTSSILAATVLAALHRVRGSHAALARLSEQTLLLEQRLSTGGGWQDQVGGIAPGVKSTVTAPGMPQRLVVESLKMSEQSLRELERRLVVYYSGQQRLARDILRRVVGRWVSREPAAVELLDDLKVGAAGLRKDLLAGRWKSAARHVGRYWEIKKQLYPGSTTPAIDLLLLELRGMYLAAGLAGAGGGGFGYFLCASPASADQLRRHLAELSARPGSLGAVYAATISRTGLTTSVAPTRAK